MTPGRATRLTTTVWVYFHTYTLRFIFFPLLFLSSGNVLAETAVPGRIISLAPHITEILFLVGAGEQVVGTVAHSDYPPEAALLPSVGSAERIDLERVLQLEPDLVIAWDSGTSVSIMTRLQQMGIRVVKSGSSDFMTLAEDLVHLGKLTGNERRARLEANAFLEAIDALKQEYHGAAPVRVFYQVWDRPLMTVNDQHLIGQAIGTCGGINLFGSAPTLVPRLDPEIIFLLAPDLIVTGGPGEQHPVWAETWIQKKTTHSDSPVRAVFIPPSLLQRPTPRMLDGTRQLCVAINAVRQDLASMETH